MDLRDPFIDWDWYKVIFLQKPFIADLFHFLMMATNSPAKGKVQHTKVVALLQGTGLVAPRHVGSS